jgi:hypothetical protein
MAARMYRRVIYIIVWTMIDQLTILITYVPRSIQSSVEVPSSSYHDHTIHVFYLDAYSLNRLGSVLFQTSMDSSFHLHRKDSFLRSLYVRRWFSRGYHGSPLSLRDSRSCMNETNNPLSKQDRACKFVRQVTL